MTPEEGLLGRTSAHEPWYPTFATEGEGKGAFRRSASSDASPFERREPDSSIATSERDWTRRFQRELVVSLSDVVSAERVEEGLVLDSPRLLARIHIPRSWPGAERLRADIARWAASERPLPFEAHDENRSAIQLTYDLRRLDPDTPPMHHILVSGEVYGYDALETSLVAALSARGVTVVGPARPRWSLVEILRLGRRGRHRRGLPVDRRRALLRAFRPAALAVALPIALTLNAHRCRGMGRVWSWRSCSCLLSRCSISRTEIGSHDRCFSAG
ncbi:MAG: hypothetical protein R3B72_41400 [Polyangiaceae bacterium]